jgi:anhydro-N-acetylmuramic acid kinase
VFRDETFLTRTPPKSLDRTDLITPNLAALSKEDASATLAYLTATTIALSLNHLPKHPKLWVLVGGGWQNPCIKQHFVDALQQIDATMQIKEASELGLENQAIEAELMAYLAIRHQRHLPTVYPAITGGAIPLVTGRLSRPQSLV